MSSVRVHLPQSKDCWESPITFDMNQIESLLYFYEENHLNFLQSLPFRKFRDSSHGMLKLCSELKAGIIGSNKTWRIDWKKQILTPLSGSIHQILQDEHKSQYTPLPASPLPPPEMHGASRISLLLSCLWFSLTKPTLGMCLDDMLMTNIQCDNCSEV